MALASATVGYQATTGVFALPTTSETITAPDDSCLLGVIVGSTATVVTIVRPGNDTLGNAITDTVSASLSNTTKWFKVDRQYIDPATGNATVTFSQVTGVTALLVRS